MPTAWRIVKTAHVASAFSGEGAARFGGRWNSPRTAVVYTSESRSLALLELLVHLNPGIRFEYMIFRLDFDARLVRKLALESLPPEWRDSPPGLASQGRGDSWVRERSSAVLRVPSVVLPEECNYLLNPAHPDFREIEIGKPSPLVLDPRLASLAPAQI